MAKRDKQQLRSRIAKFLRQYARKSGSRYARFDPNDRHYDREIEKLVKRLNPEELDRLLREDDARE